MFATSATGCSAAEGGAAAAAPQPTRAIDVESAITPETKAELEDLMVNLDEEVTAYATHIGHFPKEMGHVESLAGVEGAGSELIAEDLLRAYPDMAIDERDERASDYIWTMMEARFEALRAKAKPEGAKK
jgi:hypothetical protein